MSFNVKMIGDAGNQLFKSVGTNAGSKVIGATGGAIAGLSALGSYNAYKDVWVNEASMAQRDAILRASAYDRRVGFTGNSFLDPIFQSIADPNFLFSDVIRKVYYMTRGFTRDVVMNNIIPLTLGTTAIVWGFNQSLTNIARKAGSSIYKVGKLAATTVKKVFDAVRAIMPKMDIKPTLKFLTPKTPRGVLSLAVFGLLAGIYLPVTILEAAHGWLNRRIGEDMTGGYRDQG